MNIANLFPTEKEKQEAIDNLRGLSGVSYWKFFKSKVLEPIIGELGEYILDPDNTENMDDYKKQRKYLMMVAELPEKTIEVLSETEKSVFDGDPFFTDFKQLRKM